jgi:3',5'-cyclic AMP phosphodiesterase CpdA
MLIYKYFWPLFSMSVDTIETIGLVSDFHTGKDEDDGVVRFDPTLPEFRKKADLAVKRVNDHKPDLVCVLGDLSNGGPEDMEKAHEYLDRFEAPKVLTRGQHDSNPEYPRLFEEYFGEASGHYEFGDLAVFAVDSADPERSKMKAEINAVELLVNKGRGMTPKEIEMVEKELGENILALELARDSGMDEYWKHHDYYFSVINNYVRRIKRLQELLETNLDLGFAGRSQRKRLTDGLKASQAEIKFVITHYSPYGNYADNLLIDRDELLRACVDEKVNLLVVGDKHISKVYTHNEGGRKDEPVRIFQVGSLTNRQQDPNMYGVVNIDRERRTITACAYLVETGELATNRFWGNPNFPITFSY